MNLVYIFGIVLIISETKAFKNFTSDSDENVVNILLALKKELSKEGRVVALERDALPNDVINITDITLSDESETVEEDENNLAINEQDLDPKMKNILRWVPKRKKKKTINETEQQDYQEENNRVKAKEQNQERHDYIVEIMRNNYWTTLYLYGEVSRILRDRQVKDDLRQMIEVLETKAQEKLKQKVLDCYKRAKKDIDRESRFWDRNTNNLIIHTIKDPINEGAGN